VNKINKFESFVIKICQNNPKLRPLIRKIRNTIRHIRLGFIGWGMTTGQAIYYK